jgi:hypothetical protein
LSLGGRDCNPSFSIYTQIELAQGFDRRGWPIERFDAAVDGLNQLGSIDVVTCIQRHRPTYVRLECPLKH